MSRLTRMGAVVMAALMVLAVGAPAVAASEPPEISVKQGDTTFTVTVKHNGTAANDSLVNVTPKDENATYAGDSGLTDENGTVTFNLPDNETEVNITATVNGSSKTIMETLQAANDTDDGTDAFGLRVSMLVHNLLTDTQNHTILGLSVSEWVTANNPGSEHRSDKANPGGNSTGPPDHALNASDGNSTGPPEHAVNKSNGGGNSTSSSGNGGDNGQAKGHGNESLARPIGL